MRPGSGFYTEQSFWLLPVEPLRAALRSLIQELAAKYEAVDFEPHVTLSSGPFADDESCTITRSIAQTFQPVQLTFSKLDFTSEYTKTLFVQYQESGVVRRMSDFIKESSARPINYILNPHLSLLYKTLPVEKQEQICRSLNAPQGNYSFDRLRVIETELPLSRPEQIRRWRTVYECALGAK